MYERRNFFIKELQKKKSSVKLKSKIITYCKYCAKDRNRSSRKRTPEKFRKKRLSHTEDGREIIYKSKRCGKHDD